MATVLMRIVRVYFQLLYVLLSLRVVLRVGLPEEAPVRRLAHPQLQGLQVIRDLLGLGFWDGSALE